MSALARWFKANSYYVAGYDRTATDLTMQLAKEGMDIHYEDRVDAIPAKIRDSKERSLVVFTPAIPKSHTEYNYLKEKGYSMHKRAQVLGMISNAFKTVAVGGTHGKTTTSSMIAHLLKNAGMDITAFLGGIATNYNSNFIRNERIDENTVAVVEADEFDRSFLALNPYIAVVTASDADHLDIYGDKTSLEASFKDFIAKVKVGGKLFISEKIAKDLVDSSYSRTVCTYGINQGQFFASDITMSNGFFEFNYSDERFKIERIKLGVPGFHNVENATVAIAIALELGLHPEDVKNGIETYRGVKRRFEYLLRSDVVFVDDYAHHPVEIEAFLGSLRAMYPERKITAIFQPHLYSRTRDFAEGFAKSLSLADEVILLDIYPAREEPIEGVSADIIFKDISAGNKLRCSKAQLLEVLQERDLDVLATIGAGDIDQLVQPVFEYLKDRYHA